jgi:hypothetical protein
MLQKLLSVVQDQKKRGVAMMAGGMLGLLAGRKVLALSLFSKGAMTLEDEWRLNHPDFEGGMDDRWQRAISFYEATHRNATNRKLHIAGIPVIVAGAAGLLLFTPYRPAWFASAGAFVGGWVLNFIGHGVFEKNAPAFADDPLSFLAGPVWDLQQVLGKKTRPAAEDLAAGESSRPVAQA